MAYCPKCGKKVKRKRADGYKHCRRHGPIEKRYERDNLVQQRHPDHHGT